MITSCGSLNHLMRTINTLFRRPYKRHIRPMMAPCMDPSTLKPMKNQESPFPIDTLTSCCRGEFRSCLGKLFTKRKQPVVLTEVHSISARLFSHLEKVTKWAIVFNRRQGIEILLSVELAVKLRLKDLRCRSQKANIKNLTKPHNSAK